MRYVLTDWRVESPEFWEDTGKKIANRNLLISIFALALAFIVWQLWSVTVVYLPQVGFELTANQQAWLIGAPALSGATLRIFYSFVVPIFGGRRWTAISTLLLLIPSLGLGIAVQNPETSYSTLLILALFCGFGSGNFSSSMANISYFFPKDKKGTALGLNAGLGNLGISIMQFLIPVVVGFSIFGALGGEGQQIVTNGATQTIWLQNAGFVWVPFIVLSGLLAWFGMNDLSLMKASFKDQLTALKSKHNWYMCWLYLGTFGSFIGFSAAFPFLLRNQFADQNALHLAFFGPLIGAITRPVGGWISDKLGGARVTHWVFIGMVIAVCGVIASLPSEGTSGNFLGFFIAFMVLFALSGIGNGSTFMQIPIIFSKVHGYRAEAGLISREEAEKTAAKEGATVVGFSAAIAAYGGFFIPKSYGMALEMTGSISAAFIGFIIFYISCILLNYWYYARKNARYKC